MFLFQNILLSQVKNKSDNHEPNYFKSKRT